MIMKTTRKEALSAGDDYYYTGKLCKNWHLSKRRAFSGACVECLALSSEKTRLNYKAAKAAKAG